MTPTLRGYQDHQVASAEAAWNAGLRSTMVVAATGTGKTTSVAEVVRRECSRGGRALVLAHRRELVDQLSKRTRLFDVHTTVEIGKVQATGREQCVVSSIQTMGCRLERFAPGEFTLVVIDECHHAPSPSYRRVLEHFPLARVLGVTATPDRADGVSLGVVFESVAAEFGVVEAIAGGFLVPAHGIRIVVEDMDLSKVRSRTRRNKDGEEFTDLHPNDLHRAVISPSAVEGVTAPLVELAGDLRTIVFAVDRKHARAIVVSLRARGRTAQWVDGSLPKTERADLLRAHQSGHYQYLVNVGVLVEGYDDTAIACVAIARPTMSRVFYAQAAGRGMRPHPGKCQMLLLDFVGVSSQFDLASPENALAGALTMPVAARSVTTTAVAPTPPDPYVPLPWHARFATAVVQLVRAIGRTMRRTPGWLARVAGMLIG